jgi:phage terminase large subunit
MAYIPTSATTKLLKLDKRIRVVAGGTSAGKTISILQILIDYAQSTKGELISVVSESFPHLRRGAMRDFLNIMQEQGYFKDELWSKTDYTYTFETGSKLEFFSADQPGKVRGPRRDVLFVNEANNIPYEAFDQLRIRTKKAIWIDYNPTSEFWYYTEIQPTYEHDFITLTYLDNEALDQSIVQDIEAHRHNKNWWAVYGLGQLGEAEGRIYSGWQMIDDIPHQARLERRGMDFGYSNDPTAVVDIYYYNGGYIFDEQLYRKGLHNKQIADFINNLDQPQTMVVADSAEPKSIDEIRMYGVNILGAKKVRDLASPGKGYLKQSIDYVQDQQISVTKRSINLIKEYRNYLWQTDKEGHIINEPEGGMDHALDAARYGMESLRPRVEKVQKSSGNITSTWRR